MASIHDQFLAWHQVVCGTWFAFFMVVGIAGGVIGVPRILRSKFDEPCSDDVIGIAGSMAAGVALILCVLIGLCFMKSVSAPDILIHENRFSMPEQAAEKAP